MSEENENIELPDAATTQRLRSVAVVATTQNRGRSPCRHYFHPYGRFLIPISPYGWYRVLVYSRNSGYTIDEVLDKLRLAVAPRRLRHYYLHEGGEPDEDRDKGATFTFYVDSYELAAKLQQRGHRPPVIGVRVSDAPPNIQVDDFYRWKLRKVIVSRYDAEKRCLDLRRLYADDCWKGEFCALQQFECLEVIIEIMEQEMPQLRRLLLDDNHLCNLSGFQGVEQRFFRLQSISLQHNELKTLPELRVFERLQLTELSLRRNPLPRNYEQHLVIMFPHLSALNGHRLRWTRSSPVVSDGETDSDLEIASVSEWNPVRLLPDPRSLYLAPHSHNMQPGIRKFVRRFLKAFDGDKRSTDLEGFYHDNTLVTLTLEKEQAAWFKNTPYAVYGRQLLTSRQDVLRMFAAWPITRHLPSTMTLDLTLVQWKTLSVSITGCFEEIGATEQLRHYMRTLVLTRSQETDDFRIANELIYLGRAIHSRGHGRRQTSSLNRIQHNLMTKLSAETRLKSNWSCKFLKDTNWDYQQSLLAFQTLLRRRQLPRQAFCEGDIPIPIPIQPEWSP